MWKKLIVVVLSTSIIAVQVGGFATDFSKMDFTKFKPIQFISVSTGLKTDSSANASILEDSIRKLRESMKSLAGDLSPDPISLIKPSVGIDLGLKKEQKKEVVDPVFELASPKINVNSDVEYEDQLLISIKMLKPVNANLSVTRIDDPRSKIALKTQEKKLDQIAQSAPFYVPTKAEFAEGEKMDQLVVVGSFFDDSTDYMSIVELYDRISKSLTLAYDSYNLAYKNALKNNETLDKNALNQMIKGRTLTHNGYDELCSARRLYEASAIAYLEVKAKLDSYYEQKIVDNAPIIIDGALPYFNITLEKPTVGRYELVVTSSDTGERIGDKIEFYITNREKLSEDFYNRVKQQITDILGSY